MERRCTIGIILLVLFLLLGLLVAIGMSRVHLPIAKKLQQASILAAEGRLYQAQQLSSSARADWQRHWKLTASVSDHEPMEQIDGLFAQLDGFAAAEDTGAFAAVAGRLSQLVEAIGDAHGMTWWNLL